LSPIFPMYLISNLLENVRLPMVDLSWSGDILLSSKETMNLKLVFGLLAIALYELCDYSRTLSAEPRMANPLSLLATLSF
jgi:hypothetical protein